MAERRVGFSPQVTSTDGGPWVLLATDRRLVLMRDGASGVGLRDFLSAIISDDVTSPARAARKTAVDVVFFEE